MTTKPKRTRVSDLLIRWLVYELQRSGFRWDASAARYRDNSTGRFVAENKLLSLAEDFTTGNISATQNNIAATTDKLLSGKIDVPQWQKQVRGEIKDANIVNMQIGRGGKNAATQADYGRQGGRLRFEYRQLDGFAKEIDAGNLSDAQIRARANMYANSPRKAYFDGQTAAKDAAGLTEERRVLNPAEHCGDCVGYAAQGWQPIGTLPEPGVASVCLSNCKCTKEYR